MKYLNEKNRNFFNGLIISLILVLFGSLIKEIAFPCFLSAAIYFIHVIILYIFTEDYKPLASLNESSSKEDIENTIENKFIDEVLSYADSKGLKATLDFNGQNGIIIMDDIDGKLIPAASVVMPDTKCKYGSDEYKSIVYSVTEALDKYIEIKKNNSGEKND